jgi:coenzyme F420 hydrogenase subunit beta
MMHVDSEGFRPVFDAKAGPDRLAVCPGAGLDDSSRTGRQADTAPADDDLGSTLEIWEGWATDGEVRRRGSSGGVLSALSLFCLDSGRFSGVIHAGMDPITPWMNRNHISRTREDVLARAGSRYAPSAPCAALSDLPSTGAPHVFIGKPCDAAATSALCAYDEALAERIGLILTFFCAGTPSTRGTLDLMAGLGVTTATVSEVHYRGDGWPGKFRVHTNDSADSKTMTYQESWGRLTSYRPLRCNICPDGLGRTADIACGDAWDAYADDGDPGRSLILVRTERGRALLGAARAAGYVTLRSAGADQVLRAQTNLLDRRRSLFGRLLAFRLLGTPVPRYVGFSLFRSWLHIGPIEQFRSVAGTARRILQRGWFNRRTTAGSVTEA